MRKDKGLFLAYMSLKYLLYKHEAKKVLRLLDRKYRAIHRLGSKYKRKIIVLDYSQTLQNSNNNFQ